MRIKISVFVISFLLCNVCYGQVTKETYEKAVDYLNCKAIELSLKRSNNPEHLTKFQQEVPCSNDERLSYADINAYLVNAGGLDKTIVLMKEINALKSDFNPKWESKDAVEYLSKTTFKDEKKYKALYDFAADRANDPDFITFKTDLGKALTEKLSAEGKTNVDTRANVNTSGAVAQNTKVIAGRISDSNTAASDEGFFTLFNLLITFIIILIIIVVVITIKQLWKPNNNWNRRSKPLHNQNKAKENQHMYKTEITELKGQIKILEAEKFRLKTENDDLKTENDRLKTENDDLKVTVSNFKPTNYGDNKGTFQEIEQPVTQPMLGSPKHEIFYLSTPNEDGSFNEKSAQSTYKEGASIYKFTKLSNMDAKFQIDETESSVKLALQYPDKNIDRVCEANNAFNPNANRIVTIESGRALLEGDKWKLTKKAQIKYEHY